MTRLLFNSLDPNKNFYLTYFTVESCLYICCGSGGPSVSQRCELEKNRILPEITHIDLFKSRTLDPTQAGQSRHQVDSSLLYHDSAG